ncbi:integrase arm-type DNA-binding domain-containing protein [Mesosutterella sp. AGMB02718]|uniref:Integrase arm-type DNA-binding domain-containing protein n=1 Tax=Mesosutterella faecium TaxID=2925194 RepID=A0ABT7ILK8_9BURK|nr:integrase arm-type DNA-binding domain-containing protein [Mesosutterella sp. AGMB02718]MDL2059247.1 integrase arm-type DNA-binding domain-containing protein [Mesosutterella sp. AGMB02718]
MRKAKDLTVIAIEFFIKETKTKGRESHISDGKVPGLSLWARCVPKVTARWKYTYRRSGENKTFGLGLYPEVTLKAAREQAARLRAQLLNGIDPREEERKKKAADKQARLAAAHDAITVGELFEQFIEAQRDNWSREKYRLTEPNRVRRHIMPLLGSISVEEATVSDVARAAKAAWLERPETARKALALLGKFFDWATVAGFRRNKSNPVNLKQITLINGKVRQQGGHRGAVDWRQIPDLFAELHQRKGTAARALMYAILANVRIENAIGLRWGAVDLEKGVVRYLASEMKVKGNGDFTACLATQTVQLLKAQAEENETMGLNGGGYVFPSGAKKGAHITNAILEQTMKRICIERGLVDRQETERAGAPVYPTPHGTARASFLTWVVDNKKDRAAAEANLHHKIETKIGAAYNRADYMEERRRLTQEWADLCFSKIPH